MQLTEPTPKQWTRAEYHQMADLGWFQGQRVELIAGEVVVMNAQRFGHYAAIDRTVEALERAFGRGHWVRAQAPLVLDSLSEPEPDVSVVAGTRDDYTDHPTTAVLVVEVSDTTLNHDRTRKAGLYARAGIADYWIVNLVDGVVEVRRTPVVDDAASHGSHYADLRILEPTDSISPLATPASLVVAADLLP
jgi:Uma2 family endonuclease